MDFVFEGSYQSPKVLEIPGLLGDPSPEPFDVSWGEPISFVFPDPGVDCVLRLVIKDHDLTRPSLIAVTQQRIGAVDEIKFTITSGQAIRYLSPGIYFYEILQQRTSGDGVTYAFLKKGAFTTIEGAAAREVPEEGVAIDPLMIPSNVFQSQDMQFYGSLTDGQYFGYFQVPQHLNLKCYGIQLFAQTACSAGPVLVELASIDTNADTGIVASLGETESYHETLLEDKFLMTASSKWRMRINQSGVGAEFLTARLLLEVV